MPLCTGLTIFRRENPNDWREITRLDAAVQVTHQRRRVPHFAAKTNIIWQSRPWTETTCLSGFRLSGLSPSAERRFGRYFFGLHTGLDCMDNKTERFSPPISYARKNADGFWNVAVTWGNGRKEQLGPFKTEAAAELAWFCRAAK